MKNKFNKAFWDWFGDSKVVDENGEPLVVYHGTGTKKDFEVFYENQFFTSNDYIAESYAENLGGKVISVYLRISNLLDLRNNRLLSQVIEIAYGKDSNEFENIKQYGDAYGLGNALQGKFDRLIRYAKSNKFDGILFRDGSYDNYVFGDTYIVFSPNQIKSVNNDGTWDNDDDSILSGANMKKIDSKFNKAFWRWFGKSKVVDKKGEPLVVYHGTNAEFDVFDKTVGKKWASKFGFWFTDNLYTADFFGDRIVHTYLKLENPFKLSSKVFDKWRDNYHNNFEFWIAKRDELIAKKYDGVVIEFYDKFGEQVFQQKFYVAFYPNQIKSVNNDGTWDNDDDSILCDSFIKTKLVGLYQKLEGKYSNQVNQFAKILKVKLPKIEIFMQETFELLKDGVSAWSEEKRFRKTYKKELFPFLQSLGCTHIDSVIVPKALSGTVRVKAFYNCKKQGYSLGIDMHLYDSNTINVICYTRLFHNLKYESDNRFYSEKKYRFKSKEEFINGIKQFVNELCIYEK